MKQKFHKYIEILWEDYLQPRKFHLMQVFILLKKLNILIEEK